MAAAQASTEPPITPMNSRRLIRSPCRRLPRPASVCLPLSEPRGNRRARDLAGRLSVAAGAGRGMPFAGVTVRDERLLMALFGPRAETERLGGLEIDDQLELGRLLDWQVCRVGTFQDLINVGGGTAEQVGTVYPI